MTAASYSRWIDALETPASRPSSHSTFRALRPFSAVQKLSATTATPFVTCTTCLTPGTAFAAVASKLFTLPPAGTGGRSIEAISMPGTLTSVPYTAAPFTFTGTSSRGRSLPMYRNCCFVFSGGFCGTGSAWARSTSWP